jgi:hypothetical protein
MEPVPAWDSGLDCRELVYAWRRVMQSGVDSLGVSQKLNCPEACIRYMNNGHLASKAEIRVDVCLGGSVLNIIKYLDDLVPDWVSALGAGGGVIFCPTVPGL